jgi:uncharacterized membrane protein
MLPFLILLSVYLVSVLVFKWRHHSNLLFAGRLAMSTMLVFTATGHFLYPEGMAMMLPPVVPFKKELVLLTGILELAAAVGLLTEKYVVPTSRLLILFFILVLPANLYAAWRGVNYQEANFTGPGPAYLWFRIPLQLLFIGWVYYFGMAKRRKKPKLQNPV